MIAAGALPVHVGPCERGSDRTTFGPAGNLRIRAAEREAGVADDELTPSPRLPQLARLHPTRRHREEGRDRSPVPLGSHYQQRDYFPVFSFAFTEATHWPWFVKPNCSNPPFLQSSSVSGADGAVSKRIIMS